MTMRWARKSSWCLKIGLLLFFHIVLKMWQATLLYPILSAQQEKMELEKYFDFFPRKSRKGLPSRLSTVLSPKPFWLCWGLTSVCIPCHDNEGTGSTLGSRPTGKCKESRPGLCSESTGWSLDFLCAMSDSNPGEKKINQVKEKANTELQC